MTIRRATPADAAAVARVHVDSWRTTYRGIVPNDFLDGMSYEASAARWQRLFAAGDPDYAMFVATVGDGTVIGFANGGHIRTADPEFSGELYALYLLATHQRQGIGAQLWQAVANHLVRRGMDSLLVWVLAENSACRFYEAMGGQPMREAEAEIGGKRLREIGYGWRELKAGRCDGMTVR
ncbi:MAG: GNAT family N-acetyltransferase [Alicyclobacillus sp.]|nr:GNAT family N-acetyltransferase [Alicyclobacillus sp.]